MECNMESKRIQDDEYILQYYQISVPAVIQYLYNGLIFVLKKCLDSTKEEFCISYPHKKTMYMSLFHNLYREYANNALDIIEHKEHELRKMLTIPSHIILPEDKHHLEEYSEQKMKNLKAEITELENLYIKKKALTYICEKELEILESLKPLNEKVDDVILKLKSLQRPRETNKFLKKYNKAADTVMEKFGSVAELKFTE